MSFFKSILVPAAAILMLGIAGLPASAETTTAYGDPVIVDQNIMSLRDARATALATEPGRVVHSALVRSRAGEPVYVFNIHSHGVSHVVRVNAVTGNLLGEETITHHNAGFFDRLFAPVHWF